jgi:hypothetical protein
MFFAYTAKPEIDQFFLLWTNTTIQDKHVAAGAAGSLYNVCTEPGIDHKPTEKQGFFTQKRDK